MMNDRNDNAEVGHILFKNVLLIKCLATRKLKRQFYILAFRKWLGNALEFRLPSSSVPEILVLRHIHVYILL